MVFGCMSFIRFLMLDLGSCEFVDGVFMYGSSYSCYDGYKWVGVPSIILDDVV